MLYRKKHNTKITKNISSNKKITCSKTCKNNNHLVIPCNFKKLKVKVGTPLDINDDPFVLSIYSDMPAESCTLRNDFLRRLDKLAYEKSSSPKPHLPPNIYM